MIDMETKYILLIDEEVAIYDLSGLTEILLEMTCATEGILDFYETVQHLPDDINNEILEECLYHLEDFIAYQLEYNESIISIIKLYNSGEHVELLNSSEISYLLINNNPVTNRLIDKELCCLQDDCV